MRASHTFRDAIADLFSLWRAAGWHPARARSPWMSPPRTAWAAPSVRCRFRSRSQSFESFMLMTSLDNALSHLSNPWSCVIGMRFCAIAPGWTAWQKPLPVTTAPF